MAGAFSPSRGRRPSLLFRLSLEVKAKAGAPRVHRAKFPPQRVECHMVEKQKRVLAAIAPRCGLLKSPVVNACVLMLKANLDDCRPARIPKQRLGQRSPCGRTFLPSFERIFAASVQSSRTEFSGAADPDCSLASVLRSRAAVLTLMFADGWLKLCRSCLWSWPGFRGFMDGGWGDEGGDGRRAVPARSFDWRKRLGSI